MIEPHRKLTIAVLIASLCMLIGVGHGIGPIVILEVMIPFHHNYPLSFALERKYEDNLAASAIFLFAGQMLLLFTTVKRQIPGRLFALFVLWVGFFYLVHGIFISDSLAWFSFCTGLPFLTMSVVLFSFDIKQYSQKTKVDD